MQKPDDIPEDMNTTINGRASVATWDFDVTFLIKEQAVGFMKAVLDQDVDIPISYCTDLDATHTLHIVSVGPMSWANNLATVAELLQKFDHRV